MSNYYLEFVAISSAVSRGYDPVRIIEILCNIIPVVAKIVQNLGVTCKLHISFKCTKRHSTQFTQQELQWVASAKQLSTIIIDQNCDSFEFCSNSKMRKSSGKNNTFQLLIEIIQLLFSFSTPWNPSETMFPLVSVTTRIY